MMPKICPKCGAEMKETSSPTNSSEASGSLSEAPLEQNSYREIEKIYWLCPKCGYAEDKNT